MKNIKSFKLFESYQDNCSEEELEELSDHLLEVFDEFNITESSEGNHHTIDKIFWCKNYDRYNSDRFIIIGSIPNSIFESVSNMVIRIKPKIEKRFIHKIVLGSGNNINDTGWISITPNFPIIIKGFSGIRSVMKWKSKKIG